MCFALQYHLYVTKSLRQRDELLDLRGRRGLDRTDLTQDLALKSIRMILTPTCFSCSDDCLRPVSHLQFAEDVGDRAYMDWFPDCIGVQSRFVGKSYRERHIRRNSGLKGQSQGRLWVVAKKGMMRKKYEPGVDLESAASHDTSSG